MRHTNDSGGYTLQTIIVSAILLVVATTASVALYRAITTSADVRSFADLRSNTDERTPSEPYNFDIEYNTDKATLSWSPPLYTGTPQLSNSVSSLFYEVTVSCPTADPPTTTIISNTKEPSIDILRAEITGEDKDCELQVEVQAYDCEDLNCPGGPVAEFNETKSGEPIQFTEAATKPTNIVTTVVGDRILVSWDLPDNTGISGNMKPLLYRVGWNNGGEGCTNEKYFVISDITTTMVTVKSYINNDNIRLSGNMCPSNLSNTDNYITSNNSSYTIDNLPEKPNSVMMQPYTSKLQSPVVLYGDHGIPADGVIAELTWTRDPNADSYLLEWYREDGVGNIESREIVNTPDKTPIEDPTITVSLENNVGYRFFLWSQSSSTNSFSISEPFSDCTAVSTNTRPAKSEVKARPTEENTELLVQITQPNYASSCLPEKFCFSISPPPACQFTFTNPFYYKIRIYKAASECQIDDNKPYYFRTCMSEEPICIQKSSNVLGITEIIIGSLEGGTDYIVEAIAADINLCDVESPTIQGDAAIEFTEDSKVSLPAYARTRTRI